MQANVRPVYLAPPYQDAAEAGRLILRDGTTAIVRLAQPEDQPMLSAFFSRLSPESRARRFASATPPSENLILDLCNPSDRDRCLTLLVLRTVQGQPHVIATGSYLMAPQGPAELSLTVEDAFQGKGIGTLLFERLALLAVRHGLRRLWAMTDAENLPMIDILRHSGFVLHERRDDGHVEVDFSVVPSEASVARSEALDRVFTAVSLRPFFHPTSVAVVGASRDPSSIGYRILDALLMHQYEGAVYPVNPKASSVRSIRAYPSVRELPEPVELAIVVVPKDAVLGVVEECAARGVRALIVISAGFSEVGAEGRALQQRVVEAARGAGMRLIGPNCLGVINTDPSVRMNASFSPWYPPHGRVAMMSQSGALGIAILALANQMQLGLSQFVSVGNKADVSGNDLLQYWEQDPATDVILLYLESFGNPRRFSRIARRVSRVKPIVAVKSGRTHAGQRAAGSHTAALASSDVAVEALFHQTGVIRADTLEELFELAAALSSQPLPNGRRVVIVTNAGGPGILCADACEAGGVEVVELSDDTTRRLAEVLPKAASLSNPVDMIASATPEQFRQTIASVLSAPEVDALVVIYIPVGVALTNAILEGMRTGIREGRQGVGAGKPILACLMGDDGRLERLTVDDERIPTYVFPESPARVLSRVARYAAWRAKPQGMVLEFDDADPSAARAICRHTAEAHGTAWLSAEEASHVLEAMRLPTIGGFARDAEGAVAVARRAGFPVAVKLASRQIIHKSERGGVVLNVPDERAVREAVEAMHARLASAGEREAMDGVVIQPMIRGGVEVMVGMVDDPSFGPLMAFGLGGLHVEILRDTSFRITPLTDGDAEEMVREIRGARLLEGYRGHPAADVEAVKEILLRMSWLVESVPEIVEVDLNPLVVLPPGEGCHVVDARIRVAPVTIPRPVRSGG
ncbi:MAG TPA: GNAT family N-acetyltransferase [Candidatus Omnitrophica bacterium]|nr:MAG: GNAT family N-acetyltransferase [Omnitrophica WOR_2 bacterium GWF2_63_9]HAM41357.1 GNAT family N-acetyltransferase [Candidatus Omnitrophota bacterium]